MPEAGNALSRNPNICASCSSMADGMDEPSLPENSPPAPERIKADASDRPEENAPERIIRHFPT
jgi:division protein CdvB (Snf7/Vps24/ESCRT-III family)